MATRYVSTTASGSGDGTSASSAWTLAQMQAGWAGGDTIYLAAGTYTAASTIKPPAGTSRRTPTQLIASGGTVTITRSSSIVLYDGTNGQIELRGITLDGGAYNYQVASFAGLHRMSDGAVIAPKDSGTSYTNLATLAPSGDGVTAQFVRVRFAGGWHTFSGNGGANLYRCRLHNAGQSQLQNNYAGVVVVGCVSDGQFGGADENTVASGCVVQRFDLAGNGINTLDRCVAVGAGVTQFNGNGSSLAVGCYGYNGGAAPLVSGFSGGDIATLTADPFTDFAAGDLRLTAYGKSIPGLRAIMAGIVGTPGVTTDSLADLTAAAAVVPAAILLNTRR